MYFSHQSDITIVDLRERTKTDFRKIEFISNTFYFLLKEFDNTLILHDISRDLTNSRSLKIGVSYNII